MWRARREGRGDDAGGPKRDEMFQAGEQAGECCEDEGVQRGDYPGPGGLFLGQGAQIGADGGDSGGQGWGMLV